MSRATRGRVSAAEVAQIVRQCLMDGCSVEIDGLGVFRRRQDGSFRFSSRVLPRVFLAYVVEDAGPVGKLYRELARRGFDPWMDRVKLLPGQNWPRAIERAIEVSDFVVACFSQAAASRRGWFHSELRYALNCAARLPLDDVFVVPVRLEECDVPQRIRREIQYVDLFPDWNRGVTRLVETLRLSARSTPG